MGFGWKFHLRVLFVAGAVVSAACLRAVAGQDDLLRGFTEAGYSPSRIGSIGAGVCSLGATGTQSPPASYENILKQMTADSNKVSVELKRQLLIDYAVGFAETYNIHNYQTQVLTKASQRIGVPVPQCETGSSACDGIVRSIRELATGSESNGANWCAMFVSSLSTLVDHEAGGGPSNLLHSGKSTNAQNFASALKLLAIFDPDVSLDKNRALFCSTPTHCTPPAKRKNAFLDPGKKPIPGCMAIFQSADGKEGHVGLVIGASGAGLAGTMDLIEGNSRPVPGSEERGVFLHPGRGWGAGAYMESNDGRTIEKLYYKGCAMPWPGMLRAQDEREGSKEVAGCSNAMVDVKLKPAEFSGFSDSGPKPRLPANAGGAEEFLRGWVQ